MQEKLTKALRDLQQGLPLADDRQLLGPYLDRWLEEVAKPRIRAKTYHSYAQLIRLYLKPDLGRMPLARLKPQDLQEFLNRKRASGLSARTVQYLHALLRTSPNRAVRWGLVGLNVALLVDPPRVEHIEVIPLAPDQARALLEALESERLQALYTVPLAVGLRPGEALGLRWQDVNLDTGTISVCRALQRIEGKLQLVELKTRRSRRIIALPALAISVLKAHLARQLEERQKAGTRWHETGFVFTTAHGTPLEPRNVVRSFKRILQQAGLPDQRFYDLRHTCASLLLAQGVHPRVVMEILGHRQISLTMNTYSHVIPQLQEDAAKRMDDLLSGPS